MSLAVTGTVIQARYDPFRNEERARMEAALRAALGRLKLIEPDWCQKYVGAWMADRAGWEHHIIDSARPLATAYPRGQNRVMDRPRSASMPRSSGRDSPITLPGSPVMLSMNGAPRPSVQNAPAMPSGSPVAI